MYWKKGLKIDSVLNLSELIFNDICDNKKISKFEFNCLLDKLCFDESKNLNKYYHLNDKFMLQHELIKIHDLYEIKQLKHYRLYY